MVLATSLALAQPAASPQQSIAPSSPVSAGGFSGKVTETMDAGDYTYVQVDTGTKKIWAAAPRFPVKIGDTASSPAGMPMEKYHSKVLNRDFDVVYFTDRVSVNGTKPGADGQVPELPKNHPPIPALSAKPKIDVSGIKKAEGGKTIAEVYGSKTNLKGQTIKVRGKVVKYNAGIMGKNWLHLRDGSGAEGSNDLLITTSTDVKLGDTVLATGAVALDKDFGANYKYSVMIEDAKVTVE
jgi:hypothetical protein